MHHLTTTAHDVAVKYQVDLFQIGRPDSMVVKTQDRESAFLVYKMANDLSWIEGCYVREVARGNTIASYDRNPRRRYLRNT